MALYEGLNKGAAQRPEPPRPIRRSATAASGAWRVAEVRARAARGGAAVPWLDRLMGRGATEAVGQAAGGALATWRRRSPAAATATPRREVMTVQRMQAVGAGEGPVPRGRKGVIRGLMLALALAWVVLLIRPWQRVGALKVDVSALFARADAGALAQQTAEKRRQEAALALAQAQRLAALPLVPGSGKPLALWQDGAGRWYKVDGGGVLAPVASLDSRACLGLPELRGLAARSREHGPGRQLVLDLPDGLLPLDPAVRSEARAVLLEDPTQPVLLTYEGTRCLLGSHHWARRQRRLARVLADLAARKRRASSIDLRFTDTAVVRSAGRP